MKEFKSNDKMPCYKEGGQVAYKSRKAGKADMSSDIAQDKKIVKKAFGMHDKQEHPGEKTDLSKLKKGGRAKKEVGTVKKYCGGGMSKYKEGGAVSGQGAISDAERAAASKSMSGQGAISDAERKAVSKFKNGGGVYGAKKTAEDIKSIEEAKNFKPKKLADGGSLKPTDAQENPGLAKLPTNVRNKMGYAKKGGKVC
jgi:hypothetical protein